MANFPKTMVGVAFEKYKNAEHWSTQRQKHSRKQLNLGMFKSRITKVNFPLVTHVSLGVGVSRRCVVAKAEKSASVYLTVTNRRILGEVDVIAVS